MDIAAAEGRPGAAHQVRRPKCGDACPAGCAAPPALGQPAVQAHAAGADQAAEAEPLGECEVPGACGVPLDSGAVPLAGADAGVIVEVLAAAPGLIVPIGAILGAAERFGAAEAAVPATAFGAAFSGRLMTERATAAAERSGLRSGDARAARRGAGLGAAALRGRALAADALAADALAFFAAARGLRLVAAERSRSACGAAIADFSPAAASLAALRAFLAALFEALRSLRASFSWAFTVRTCFLAASARADAVAASELSRCSAAAFFARIAGVIVVATMVASFEVKMAAAYGRNAIVVTLL